IKSVSHSTGLIFGTLLVDTGGQVKKMEHVMKEDAPKIAALLSGLLHDSNKSQENTPIPASGSDAVSQLERLAALKEKGILTEEEFAQQKTKILAG
ncbi:SHOCT domain-containing protein, partial [Desulfosarcina sp. OttesenSCG-928-G17]|nr:SHOCT domain-containing protein [Desulfosarcina sp. OttesenSCG-928-G17]